MFEPLVPDDGMFAEMLWVCGVKDLLTILEQGSSKILPIGGLFYISVSTQTTALLQYAFGPHRYPK